MEFSGCLQGSGRIRSLEGAGAVCSFEVHSVIGASSCDELQFATVVRIWNANVTYFDGVLHGPDPFSSFRVAVEFVVGTLKF